MPVRRVILTGEAIAVLRRFHADAEYHHGIYIADTEFLRERDLHEGLTLSVMEQQQGAPRRFLGKYTEIHAAIYDRRAKRHHSSDPVLKSLDGIRWYRVDLKHAHRLLISALPVRKADSFSE